MTEQYELDNFDRRLRFRGDRIAHSTSRSGQNTDAIRWSDVDLYRTSGGMYVVHKIGQSRVYHGGPKECAKNGGKSTTTQALLNKLTDSQLDDLVACPVCRPADLSEPNHKIKLEVARGVTATSTTARGLVESCYNEDKDGVVFLPNVAKRALEQAAAVDPAIFEAYMVENIA